MALKCIYIYIYISLSVLYLGANWFADTVSRRLGRGYKTSLRIEQVPSGVLYLGPNMTVQCLMVWDARSGVYGSSCCTAFFVRF